MTTVHVRRATMVLCGVFLAAAFAFAWLAERRAPPRAGPAEQAGAAVFAARCAACHAAQSVAQLIRNAPDRRAKVRTIDALLVSHGEASPAEIPLILAFLEGLAAR